MACALLQLKTLRRCLRRKYLCISAQIINTPLKYGSHVSVYKCAEQPSVTGLSVLPFVKSGDRECVDYVLLTTALFLAEHIIILRLQRTTNVAYDALATVAYP